MNIVVVWLLVISQLHNRYAASATMSAGTMTPSKVKVGVLETHTAAQPNGGVFD